MTGWEWYDAWRRVWRSWLDTPRVEFPTEEEACGAEVKRTPDNLHKAFRKHIEDQERIRCLLDKNIEAARSIDQDILSVVNEMMRRRDENDAE